MTAEDHSFRRLQRRLRTVEVGSAFWGRLGSRSNTTLGILGARGGVDHQPAIATEDSAFWGRKPRPVGN